MEEADSPGAPARVFVTNCRMKTQGISMAHLGPTHTMHITWVEGKAEGPHQYKRSH